MTSTPNEPAAPNPAIASRLHARCHWRGVGEPERWADVSAMIKAVSVVLTVAMLPFVMAGGGHATGHGDKDT